MGALNSSFLVFPWCLYQNNSVAEFERLIHRPTPPVGGLGLDPTNPPLTNIAGETLGIRQLRLLTEQRYSYRHSHSHQLQQTSRFIFTVGGTLPYRTYNLQSKCYVPLASVSGLIPDHFRRQNPRPVSCYAIFKGWLPLSQPPGCLGNSTSFTTEPAFRDLSLKSRAVSL